ncbi:MAG TPA: hypothetical protein VNQ90_08475 [Chthoniobacteraceae bacterium]|nr:hypothetical protein [Chthoniobacteraceae bacterium]
MAFHVNLFHEIHTEAHQRARDPAKLAGLGLAVIALFLIGFYVYRMNAVGQLTKKQSAMERQWSSLQPKMKKAEKDAVTLTQQKAINEVLIARLDNRFYWAPFLERLTQSVPPHVQVTSLSGEWDPGSRKAELFLSGIAAGEQPRVEAEAFRVGLEKELGAFYSEVSARFDAHSLEETQQVIEHEGQQLRTARFRIRLAFKPAAPAPAPKEPLARKP